jgi:hypothetical protein
MSNEDKMLQLVLSDKNLNLSYEYDPNEYPTIDNALKSDNPVVVAVAKIIREIRGKTDKNVHREVYDEVFNYLNQNIL